MILNDPFVLLGTAALALIAVTIAARALLSGWRDWLALRRFEIEARAGGAAPSAASRIELADLRERLRKLEAIAAGVDL